MPSDDVADRIMAALDGTPERRANYLNSGRAESDLRELLRQRDEARARAYAARAARLALEEQVDRLEREVAWRKATRGLGA